MIERYFEIKIFLEYKLPFILFGIIIAVMLLHIGIILIKCKWEERQQKKIDECFKDDDEQQE